MSRIPIEGSTAVRAYEYFPDADGQGGILEIEFPGARVYRYDPVPPALFEEFLAAPSKGRFLSSLAAACACRRVA